MSEKTLVALGLLYFIGLFILGVVLYVFLAINGVPIGISLGASIAFFIFGSLVPRLYVGKLLEPEEEKDEN